jgi:hypothetical protein
LRHNVATTPARSTITAVPVTPSPDAAAAHAGDGTGVVAWYAESFSDVLGDRLGLFDSSGPSLQLLRFSTTALALADFDISLRGRLAQVFGFRHPAFALVRGVTTLEESGQLALVSQQARGERLSVILRAAESRGARLDVDAAIWLLRHVVAALADFHEATGGLAHGWLDTDRVTVAATGEVTITEYVFGGVSAAHARAEPVDDVRDAAWVALAVLAGRPVAPLNRSDPWAGARAVDAVCGSISPGSVLAPWLKQAVAGEFATARVGMIALEDLLAGVPGRWRTKLIAEAAVTPREVTARHAGQSRQPVGHASAAAEPAFDAPVADARPTLERLTRRNRVLMSVAAVQAVLIVALLLRGAPAVGPERVSRERDIRGAGVLNTPGTAESSPSPAATLADAVAAVAAQPGRAPDAPAASVIGWLVVDASVEVKVYANGRLLGTTTRGRFGLPAGQHTITVVSDAYGYRSSQPIRIVGGKSALIAPRPQSIS